MHYFSRKPEGELRIYKFSIQVRGISLKLVSASGVFSARRVDLGTKVLLENMIVKDYWRILDLGCGYGIIGLVAAKLAPHGFVIMTDINKRAIKLARINAKLNKIKNIEIRHGDLYEPVEGEVFDTIISNPPQAAGMRIIKRLIEGSTNYLKEGGLLQLVARHNKGGKRIFDIMGQVFKDTYILGGRGGYRVYIARK